MPIASWIMPTHYRPALIERAVASVLGQRAVPADWRQELVIVAMWDDWFARRVAKRVGATFVPTKERNVGAKRTAGLRASAGSIILNADDDDLQSPIYLAATIQAHERGHGITGVREFVYQDIRTGARARWRSTCALVGYHRAYDRSLLIDIGGWANVPRMVEAEATIRAGARWPKEHDVSQKEIDGLRVADTMVNLQHDGNIWQARPFPAEGQPALFGKWIVTGLPPVREPAA